MHSLTLVQTLLKSGLIGASNGASESGVILAPTHFFLFQRKLKFPVLAGKFSEQFRPENFYEMEGRKKRERVYTIVWENDKLALAALPEEGDWLLMSKENGRVLPLEDRGWCGYCGALWGACWRNGIPYCVPDYWRGDLSRHRQMENLGLVEWGLYEASKRFKN